MSEQARPMNEKKELLMGLWADKLILKHYPNSITGMELATKTSVEEITQMIKELNSQIEW
jgi:hypothetical protein